MAKMALKQQIEPKPCIRHLCDGEDTSRITMQTAGDGTNSSETITGTGTAKYFWVNYFSFAIDMKSRTNWNPLAKCFGWCFVSLPI